MATTRTVQVKTNVARQFKDLDLNFNIHPVRKDINKHFDEMAVINSIKHLVLIAPYEKLFQPDIGCNITQLLFENADNITAVAIENEIKNTIKNFEPRVQILDLKVVPNVDQNAFSVYLEFQIVNRPEPIEITFLLERSR
jgi:phage baseplate assembly protein W